MGMAKYYEDNISLMNGRIGLGVGENSSAVVTPPVPENVQVKDNIEEKKEVTVGLNTFVVSRPERAMPIFILADTSGSMEGEKIAMLNNALREMVATLASIKDIRGVFQVAIITFGNNVASLHQKLTDVKEIQLTELKAIGKTPMGAAIEMVTTMIEDKSIVPSTAYTATIVLISDGKPTDKPEGVDYQEWAPIKQLLSEEKRGSKCLRLAMGIGVDAEKTMLKAFVNNESIKIFDASEASDIEPFFKWVTMSTVSRMKSSNPDDASIFFPVDRGDDLPI
jgi:uncharacterized protein YegL